MIPLLTRKKLTPSAWWEFEEGSGTTATDLVSGNIATLGVSGVAWTAGKTGNGLTFATGSCQVPDSPSVNMTGDFTYSIWVNSVQVPVLNQWPMFIYKKSGSPAVGIEMALHESNIIAAWYAQINADGTNYTVRGSSDVADGTWHHLAVVRSRTMLLAYQDGVPANRRVASTSSISNTGVLFFGGSSATPNNPFLGTIDKMRFYARALSAGEIAALAIE